MKIFLTGATGFIGSHLLERLLSEGVNVAIYIRKDSDFSRILHLKNEKNLSLINENTLVSYFQNQTPEYVIHLSTCYKKQHTPTEVSIMIEANITFPTKLLQLCHENNVSYFINTGTFFEYDSKNNEIITEQTKTGSYNLYASTKLAFIEVLKFFSNKKNIKSVNLRLFSPYGEKDNIKIIPLIIKKLLSGEEVSLINQKLCFTYVDDIVDAYTQTLKYIPQSSDNYIDINIGSKSYSISDVVNFLEEYSGKKVNISGGKYAKHNEKNIYCDANRAYTVLGWKQKTSFERGLTITYDYYKNENS